MNDKPNCSKMIHIERIENNVLKIKTINNFKIFDNLQIDL